MSFSGSPFGIGEYLAAQNQSDAITDAANTEAESTQAGIDAMLQMWQAAQDDFAPFLQYGQQGVEQLASQVPGWVSQTISPMYNDLMNFNYQQAPNANNYAIDPVTGRPIQTQQQPTQQPTYQSGNMMQPGGGGSYNENQRSQGQLFSQTVQQPTSTTERGAMIDGTWVPESELTADQLNPYIDQTTGGTEGYWDSSNQGRGDSYDPNIKPIWVPGADGTTSQIANPNYAEITTREVPGVSTQQASNLYNYNALAPQQQTDFSVPDFSASYSQGGALSPLVPDFQRSMENYQFDTNDPYYQTRLRQKNEEIDNFLAKQGLAGSTPGESYRQRELDKFTADEFGNQYNRALTERNYLTQTDVDKYNLEANRGNTLYGRTQDQLNTLYGRQSSNAATSDANRLALLTQRYGAGTDAYSQLYGNALDAAKIGQGAAASTGSGSMQAGSNMLNAYQQSGANQANALMANSNVWNQYMQGMMNQGSSVANSLMDYFGNNNSGGYTGGGGGNYYNGSSNPYNTGGYTGGGYAGNPYNVGSNGTTAFGM